MTLGPLEYLVVGFEGNRFTGEILPELHALRERDIVRIVDLLFLQKDQGGNIVLREVSDLSAEEARAYGPIAGDLRGLLTEEDIKTLASSVPTSSSCAILLLEDQWASRLRETIGRANGVILEEGRIPEADVEDLEAELSAAQADRVDIQTSTQIQ
jgi:uncharacterized membrane protein